MTPSAFFTEYSCISTAAVAEAIPISGKALMLKPVSLTLTALSGFLTLDISKAANGLSLYSATLTELSDLGTQTVGNEAVLTSPIFLTGGFLPAVAEKRFPSRNISGCFTVNCSGLIREISGLLMRFIVGFFGFTLGNSTPSRYSSLSMNALRSQ